jgi:hypothetical protein
VRASSPAAAEAHDPRGSSSSAGKLDLHVTRVPEQPPTTTPTPRPMHPVAAPRAAYLIVKGAARELADHGDGEGDDKFPPRPCGRRGTLLWHRERPWPDYCSTPRTQDYRLADGRRVLAERCQDSPLCADCLFGRGIDAVAWSRSQSRAVCRASSWSRNRAIDHIWARAEIVASTLLPRQRFVEARPGRTRRNESAISRIMARSEGFEPPTPRFEVWCFIRPKRKSFVPIIRSQYMPNLPLFRNRVSGFARRRKFFQLDSRQK